MSTSLSTGASRLARARAGRWCRAAARRAPGTALCTWAATEPLGGTRGSNSSPILVMALAMEMTTFPSSCLATAPAAAAAASHGVATTTTSASAAVVLSAGVSCRFRSGQRSTIDEHASSAL